MTSPLNRLKDLLSKFKENGMQKKVFGLLSDQKWHCRVCEGTKVASGQYAGGGGIQGLQGGTRRRPGLVIVQERRDCPICKRITLHDRWTGEFRQASAAAHLSKKLQDRIVKLYDYKDAVENRQRQPHDLLIDHRFPLIRWGGIEPIYAESISDDELRRKFQLLKRDDWGNHNQLKSRACEKCFESGIRGAPLGIEFYYSGNRHWPKEVPKEGPEAETGCLGCGWYDLEAWRNALNKTVSNSSETRHKG